MILGILAEKLIPLKYMEGKSNRTNRFCNDVHESENYFSQDMISVIHLPPEDKIPNPSRALLPLEETKRNPYFEPSMIKEGHNMSSNGFSVV